MLLKVNHLEGKNKKDQSQHTELPQAQDIQKIGRSSKDQSLSEVWVVKIPSYIGRILSKLLGML
jgi:hypothetical protein